MNPVQSFHRIVLAAFLPCFVALEILTLVSGMGQAPPESVAEPAVAETVSFPSISRAIAEGLQRQVSEMDRLNRLDAIEPLVENTMRSRANDWRVLFQGARIYSELVRAGYWVNQRYRRGDLHGKPPKGARRVFSHKRDHVRALQLLDRAIRLSTRDPNMTGKADFYWEAAQILTGEKAFLGMYELTDLSGLPTLDFHEPQVLNREPVPVGADGVPQFFRVPPSWSAARNDGERLLWLLSRARQLNPEFEAEAEFIHAKHLLKAYLGVQTVTETPAYDARSRTYRDEDGAAEALLGSLDALSREETVAVLADRGVQKFALPEEHNFILRLERMTRDARYFTHGALALEELAEVFETRRQYDRAAEYWKALLKRTGQKQATQESGIVSWEQARLNQIVKSWGRFEDVQPVQAGDPLKLAYWYRNGNAVNFTAYRVDVNLLVEDLLAYLRSDPFPIDPNRISVSKLGLNIVRQGGERYLKEQVKAWSQNLTPSEKHWDQRIEVPVPIEQPGAYLIEAEIDGGHRCSVLAWINDMTILRRPLEDGLFYYVADKRKGTPVGWAKFTFVGYRLVLVNQEEEPELDVHGEEVPEALQRQYHVLTKEITKWADAKGQLTLDASVLQPDYRWFLLTSAPNDRVAVLGFSDLQPTAEAPRREVRGMRQFLTTDRASYRPGQTCAFKGWVRESEPNTEEQSGHGIPQPVLSRVSLINHRDEVVAEVEAMTDEMGGFKGELGLPADLSSGPYRLVSQCAGGTTSVEIEMEPSASPPVQLVLENSVRQLARGEAWRLVVRSEDGFGEPLGQVPVRYRVLRRPHRPVWRRDQPHAWLFGETYDAGAPSAAWYPDWKYWGWDWGQPDVLPEGEVVLEREISTGEDGTATLSIPTSGRHRSLPVEEDYHLEVRVRDEPEMSPAGAMVTVSERPYKVYVKLDQAFYSVGNEVGIEAWVRRYDGSVVRGTGELILYKVEFAENGKPIEWGWRRPLHPDANGYAATRFSVREAGQYRASYTVTDALGNRHEGACVFIVATDGFTGEACRFNSLEILTDRVVYQPGDRVQVRFNTENLGQSVAVFVRPRDGVFGKAEVLRLDQKSTPYQVKVSEEDRPSFFVEAIVLQGGEFEVHTKEILVSPPSPALRIGLRSEEREYLPGSEARLSVTLADSSGEPVAGEVALSMTPQRPDLLDLKPPALADAFWNERQPYAPSVEHGLKTTFQSFSSPPEASMRPIGIFGSVQIGEETEPYENVGMEDEETVIESGGGRQYAIPTSAVPTVWRPSVPVDASGRAEMTLPIPDWEGGWRVHAWALDGKTRVGEATLKLTSRSDWALRLRAPSTVVEGDRFVVSARLRNRMREPAEAELAFASSGSLHWVGALPETSVEVGVDETCQVAWEVEAVERSDEAFVNVRVGPGEALEESRRTVRILERLEKEESRWNAHLTEEGGESDAGPRYPLAFSLPEDVVLEESQLIVHVASGLFEKVAPMFTEEVLADAMTEQTAEKMMGAVVPALAFGRYVRGLNEAYRKRLSGSFVSWILEDGGLEGLAQSVADRLWAQQGEEGGWNGYGEASDVLSTAAVLESLADLQALELVSHPEDRLEKAIDWLGRMQSAESSAIGNAQHSKSEASTLDAYVYLTLLRHGRDHQAMRDFLFRDWRKLTMLGKLMVAQALHLRGDIEDRNVIRYALGEKLEKDERSGAIRLPSENERYSWKWFGSASEVQGRYVHFLVDVKGDGPVTDGAARQLLGDQRKCGVWNSPRGSGRAKMALLSIMALRESKPTVASFGQVALWQGDRKIQESAIDTESGWGVHLFELSGKALAEVAGVEREEDDGPAGEPLEVAYSGSGPAQLHAHLEIARRPLIMGMQGGDLSVERRYERESAAGESSEPQALRPGDGASLDEVLAVTVVVEADREMEHLEFTDHLPAGFEIVGELPSNWQLEQGELRVSFPTLKEPQSFHYRIKANTRGRFHALPATLEAEYVTSIRARSEEMVFLVRE